MLLRLIFILFLGLIVVAHGTAQKVKRVKKPDLEGYWFGIGTEDISLRERPKFDYELQLRIIGDKVEGFSITTLTIDGQKYVAKAKIAGELHDNYFKCRETENYYEERLPSNGGWIPFDRIELILRKKGENCTLEGLYEVEGGKYFGRLKLEKTPPRV